MGIVASIFRVVPNKLAYALSLELSRKANEHLKTLFLSFGSNSHLANHVVVISPGRVKIGSNCEINEFVHILGGGCVEIGDRVWIANHASIVSVTHPVDVEFIGDHPNVGKPVIIEDEVWIGSHAVILPGLKIGRGAVVGAGCVVTKDVPPLAIVTGIPATLMRYKNFSAP